MRNLTVFVLLPDWTVEVLITESQPRQMRQAAQKEMGLWEPILGFDYSHD